MTRHSLLVDVVNTLCTFTHCVVFSYAYSSYRNAIIPHAYLPTDMSTSRDDEHPFVISAALPLTFGYTAEFIAGSTVWDSNATDGGGRHSAVVTLQKMKELGKLTREGAPLADRQAVLSTCWHQHYDANRIEFILNFLIGSSIQSSPKLNKTEAIKKLVELNAPFIPFPILNEHLKRGLTKYKGKTSFPTINWDASYAAFCQEVPFDSTALNDERKKEKMALAIDFWREATLSHNEDVPPAKNLNLSDTEIAKLSGSQFSISVGGTPAFHKPATAQEKELRDKLLAVTTSYKAKKEKLRLAEDYERKASELRGSMSVISRAAPSKRKPEDSDDDDSQQQSQKDTGIHALDVFLKATRRKVELAEYIDFAALSTSRLKEIKMLNCASSKSSKIAVGLVLRHSLSEADVAILSDDFSQISDGFHYHYLKVVSESNLHDPLATVIDRLGWWQWMCQVFGKNFAAQVKFIKNFLVEHHDKPFWTPLVKLETNLVILCKEQAPLANTPKPGKKETGGKPSQPAKAGNKQAQGNQKARVVLTAAQSKKIEEWKLRFPSTCMSRMVRGRNCFKENNGGVCRFSHNCAWCGSASCKADCQQAETL